MSRHIMVFLLLLLLLSSSIVCAAEDARCGAAGTVDPADTDLMLFMTCVCAETVCRDIWGGRYNV